MHGPLNVKNWQAHNMRAQAYLYQYILVYKTNTRNTTDDTNGYDLKGPDDYCKKKNTS